MRLFWIVLLCVVLPLGAIGVFTWRVISSAQSERAPLSRTETRSAALRKLDTVDWQRLMGSAADRVAVEGNERERKTLAGVLGHLAHYLVAGAEGDPEEAIEEESVQAFFDFLQRVQENPTNTEALVFERMMEFAADPEAWSSQMRAIVLSFLVGTWDEIHKQRGDIRRRIERAERSVAASTGAVREDRERKLGRLREALKLIEAVPEPTDLARRNWETFVRVAKARIGK